MPNMSYCRFENTLGDLRDCYDNLDHNALSDSEAEARTALIKLCKQIVDDHSDSE